MSKYTYTEEIPETSLIRQVQVKKVKTGQTERITESHLLTDSISGQADSKEIHHYITRDGKTRETRHVKWWWRDNKWVKIEAADLPKSY